jgi:hypothetical protein
MPVVIQTIALHHVFMYLDKFPWWSNISFLIDNQVVRALEGDVSLEDLNEGVRPGHSHFFGSYSESDYDSSQYNEDMKKFRKMAFNNNNYTSSQYSAPTSEYGQVQSASSSEGQQTQEMLESGVTKKSAYSGYSSGYSRAS